MKLSLGQGMKYSLIIFDFDGTMADSSEGILDAHRYTLNYYNETAWNDDMLKKFIGGNLLDIYVKEIGFDELKAREAVKVYRSRYAIEGIKKARLYNGMLDVLKKLKQSGCLVGIATLKADKFIKEMIDIMDIKKYIDVVYGINEADDLSKSELIDMCINDLKWTRETVLFVGDSYGDYIGGKNSNVDFLGVSYGFGLKQEKSYEFDLIKSPIELLKYIGIEN